MEQVMYDVYIAEAVMENDYANFNTSEKKEAYINKVFNTHKVNQAQWDTSLSWYSDRIDLYLRMNDSVKSRLKRHQSFVDSEIAKRDAKIFEMDESVYSASYIPKFYNFAMPGTQRTGFKFSIDSTKISEIITDDYSSLDFTVMGVKPSYVYKLSSLLSLVYDDTTVYHSERVTDNKTYSFPIAKYIAEDTLKQIYGFINLENPTGINPNILLYSISLGDK